MSYYMLWTDGEHLFSAKDIWGTWQRGAEDGQPDEFRETSVGIESWMKIEWVQII